VICAYGRDDKSCATLSACDDANLAALETLAGPWAARRACKAAALRRGDAAAAAKLDESPVERTRRMKWRNLQVILFALLLFAGTVAGLVLVRAQRRSPAPPPSPPPAPWTKAELYAALVRCAVLPLLLVIVVLSVLGALKLPSRSAFGIVLYLLAWGWVARLLFRRFGLSWTDALFARRGEPSTKISVVALFAIAAIGLDRAGHFMIRSAAGAIGLRTPWSDVFAPQTAQVSIRLIAVILEVVILAPLVEELVCRRVIFAAFRRRRSFVWAALASAAIFAVPHAYSTIGTSVVMWTGLVTAWAYDRTGSLWPSLLVHASGNAFAVLSGLS
jgi:membrane protease YdiL (CAAX protease family)